MKKIKDLFLTSKIDRDEISAVETILPKIETKYGKKLDINQEEKNKLLENLTPRERETYSLLLEGYTLKEAALQLGIGYSTANTYQTAIYRKLHVNSRAELIINFRETARAREEGEPK